MNGKTTRLLNRVAKELEGFETRSSIVYVRDKDGNRALHNEDGQLLEKNETGQLVCKNENGDEVEYDRSEAYFKWERKEVQQGPRRSRGTTPSRLGPRGIRKRLQREWLSTPHSKRAQLRKAFLNDLLPATE